LEVKLLLSVIAEDPALITKFVDELRKELSSFCGCVDFAFANVVCECSGCLLVMSLEMDKIHRIDLGFGMPRTVTLTITVVGEEIESMMKILNVVKGISKACGVAVRVKAL